MHKLLFSIIGISITVMLSLFLGQFVIQIVNAQQANMATVIEEKFTRELGSGQVMPPVSHSWVNVMYESPNTIVLGGDLIASERDVDTRLQPSTYWNADLWSAMDLLKNQYGFKLQQVMTNGVGSVGNPTTVYILMIK